jgi:hypothetical protein
MLVRKASRRTHMDQLHFEGIEAMEAAEPQSVDLDQETTDAVVALMARALLAVVHATREADDEH